MEAKDRAMRNSGNVAFMLDFGSLQALHKNGHNFAGRAPFYAYFTILESTKHQGC